MLRTGLAFLLGFIVAGAVAGISWKHDPGYVLDARGLRFKNPGAMIEMPVSDDVVARIRACSEYPELVISINREADPTCGLTARIDNPNRPSLSIQLRGDPDEEDIILYWDKSHDDGVHDAFLRLTKYGTITAIEQTDVSPIGTRPTPSYSGAQIIGTDARLMIGDVTVP